MARMESSNRYSSPGVSSGSSETRTGAYSGMTGVKHVVGVLLGSGAHFLLLIFFASISFKVWAPVPEPVPSDVGLHIAAWIAFALACPFVILGIMLQSPMLGIPLLIVNSLLWGAGFYCCFRMIIRWRSRTVAT